MDELFEALLVLIAVPIFYIAGREQLLDKLAEMFLKWTDDFITSNQSKGGFTPETKQAILDDFMKGVE
jgi:hypothetical protein